ncbi:PREDICTED: F-box protein FBW2-like [Fragaria vesca subsp. vesca]|uniref:F-box protein FBW2-like n=1 Tax=Fragaria vesca subsp. vesca TaxID=101020 RepID=UPI0002C30D02|nr:PREDICTED: F-box protein FBW2-like [Fragaria vesca subsp. vesca]
MDWLLSPKRKCRTKDRRRWEDLNRDCLVNVFEKVGIESMLLAIPFVCKTWYKTSLDPACWKRLIFPNTIDPWSSEVASNDRWDYHDETESSRFEYFTRRFAREFGLEWRLFSVPKFINNVINRSKGEAQYLKLPGICSGYTFAIRKILTHINKNCSKFCGLHLSDTSIDEDDTITSAIIEFVPIVKFLCLSKSRICRNDLVKILKGCKELEVLDVRECIGFDEGDEKILELACHIPKFMCAGSKCICNFVSAPLIEIHDEEDEDL